MENQNRRWVSTVGMDVQTWHKTRQTGIGSSDAPAILGVSAFKTPYDIWLRKTAPEPIIDDETPKMTAGKELEDAIARWWAKEFGIRVVRDNKFRLHPSYDFIFAELDRIAMHPERGPGLIEVKNTERRIFERWRVGDMPLSFYIQIQHQFMCSGLEWGVLVCLLDGWDMKTIEIFPDHEFIDGLEQKEVRFWNDYVIPKVAPELTNFSDVEQMYPKHEPGKAVELDRFTLQAAVDLQQVLQQIEDLNNTKESLQFQVAKILGDAECGTSRQYRVVTFKKNLDGIMVDAEKLEAQWPSVYEKCLKPRRGARILRLNKAQLTLAAKESVEALKRTQAEVQNVVSANGRNENDGGRGPGAGKNSSGA